MRALVQLVPLCLLCFGIACSTTVRVAVDEEEDFSGYHTWDWLPESPPTARRAKAIPPSLYALVARHIEHTLHSQGYRRGTDRADFFVSYDLTLERRIALVQEPFPPTLVSSYNSSASFWVEGTDTVQQRVTDVTLAIRVSEARGRTTWLGWLQQRIETGVAVPVDSAVTTLLARFAEKR